MQLQKADSGVQIWVQGLWRASMRHHRTLKYLRPVYNVYPCNLRIHIRVICGFILEMFAPAASFYAGMRAISDFFV